MVRHVLNTPYLQSAFRDDSIFQNSVSDVAIYLTPQSSGDTRIKSVHAEIISHCKHTGREAPFADIELLDWMLRIRNLTLHRVKPASLEYPDQGKRFARTHMISTETVMSGDVQSVLVPGIPALQLKALVVVG